MRHDISFSGKQLGQSLTLTHLCEKLGNPIAIVHGQARDMYEDARLDWYDSHNGFEVRNIDTLFPDFDTRFPSQAEAGQNSAPDMFGNNKSLASSFFDELMEKFDDVADAGNGALLVGLAALGEILFQPYQPAISVGGGGSTSKLGWGDDDKYKKKNGTKLQPTQEVDNNILMIYSYGKNELLEEILDDLSVIKGKDEARDKQLADIQKTLNELLDKFAQVPQNEQSDNAPLGNGLTYGTLKDAVYDGMADYYKDQPDSTGILTENNLMTIHDIFWDLYQKEFAKYRQEEKEEIQKKRDEIAKQRHAQGIKEISQVAEWAPEYPIEIQRLIRFIGMNSLEETEPVETAHKILKVWGDTF